MKRKLLFLAAMGLAFPVFSWAQAATQFVKVPEGYCWQYTKEYVKTNGRGFTFDETQHLLKGQFAELRSGGGDITTTIRTVPDKNKKGEEGCSIVVDRVGGAAASSFDQRVNSTLESSNIQRANKITAFVTSKDKDRVKKEKKP